MITKYNVITTMPRQATKNFEKNQKHFYPTFYGELAVKSKKIHQIFFEH